MLQAYLGESAIPGPPQRRHPQSLSECPFDTGAGVVLGLELGGGLPVPGRLQREMLSLRPHGDLPGPLRSSRALPPARTVLAVVAREANIDDLAAMPIVGHRPLATWPPPGTRRPPRFPIEGKAGDVEALPRAGLPGAIREDRPDHADAMGVV